MKGLTSTTFTTGDICTTMFYQVTHMYVFAVDDTTSLTNFLLSVLYLMSMIGFIQCFFGWKCRDSRPRIQARFVVKKQETKCYLNWTCLYYRGNTTSKTLPQQDEYHLWIYLRKDKFECGNTASVMRGGPVAKNAGNTVGQYFQAVL